MVARQQANLRTLEIALLSYQSDFGILPEGRDNFEFPAHILEGSGKNNARDIFRTNKLVPNFFASIWFFIIVYGIIIFLYLFARKTFINNQKTRTDQAILAFLNLLLIVSFLAPIAWPTCRCPHLARAFQTSGNQLIGYSTDSQDNVLLFSLGPDGDSDLDPENWNVESLPLYEYDPTNGALSSGDLFRLIKS